MAHVVTFFSFKGGVGRSVLLANIAYILATRQRKVVCVDFDLEAGGLHTIFGIDSAEIQNSILDVLTGELRVFEKAIIPIKLPPSVSGKIWLLPAISDYNRLDRIEMSRDSLVGPLDGLIQGIEERYTPHFIFVDARAGFAELSSPALDAARFRRGSVVLVARLNRQNSEGLKVFLDVIENSPKTPHYCVTLSQVPLELPQAKPFIQSMNKILGPHRSVDFVIPYDSRLALQEVVFGLGNAYKAKTAGYTDVADWIEARANDS